MPSLWLPRETDIAAALREPLRATPGLNQGFNPFYAPKSSHRIWSGLVHGVVVADKTIPVIREEGPFTSLPIGSNVTGSTAVVTSRQPGPSGFAITTTTGHIVDTTGTTYTVQESQTAIVIYQAEDSSGDTLFYAAAGNLSRDSIGLRYISGSDHGVYFKTNNSAETTHTHAGNWKAGHWYVLAARRSISTTGITNFSALYDLTDGILTTVETTPAQSAFDTIGVKSLTVTANRSAARTYGFGLIMSVGGLNLTNQELTDIARDPWNSLFVPANDSAFRFEPAAGGGVSLTAETGSFTHTGIAAGLLAGRKVSAEAQSYALTGQDAGLLAGRTMTAAAATYALTGIDAGLTYTPVGSYSLTADVGSFTLTGIDAGTLFGRAVVADAQSYALTGNDATLTYTPSGAYDLTADVGAFLLTGNDAALTYAPAGSFTLTADPGAFDLTGQAANLLAARSMPADAASFELTGIDVGLAQGRGLSAETGSFDLTGIDVGFGRTYQVAADLGEFTLTGVAVTLRYSEAVTMSGRVQLERGTLRSIRSTRTLRT